LLLVEFDHLPAIGAGASAGIILIQVHRFLNAPSPVDQSQPGGERSKHQHIHEGNRKEKESSQ
jgi:hypothetical protein